MKTSTAEKRAIRPTHPGILLKEEFLPDYGLTVSSLAAALKVSRQTVNELLNGRRSLTPHMALRLSRLFGNSPQFWTNAQLALDLWLAEQQHADELKELKKLRAA